MLQVGRVSAGRSGPASSSHRPGFSPAYVDNVVRDALLNPKVRLTGGWLFYRQVVTRKCMARDSDSEVLCTVLRYDADVGKFVDTSEQRELTFPDNLSSYQVKLLSCWSA